jgi:hypothetical protein
MMSERLLHSPIKALSKKYLFEFSSDAVGNQDALFVMIVLLRWYLHEHENIDNKLDFQNRSYLLDKLMRYYRLHMVHLPLPRTDRIILLYVIEPVLGLVLDANPEFVTMLQVPRSSMYYL